MPNNPQHENSVVSLERRLRLAPPPRLHSAPPGFTTKVILRLDAPDDSPAPRLLWPRLAWTFACAAVFVLAGATFLREKPQERPQVHVTQAAPAPDLLDLQLPVFAAGRFESLSAQLDQPLEKELASVISDTRQAIQFIAASFLPEE